MKNNININIKDNLLFEAINNIQGVLESIVSEITSLETKYKECINNLEILSKRMDVLECNIDENLFK